MLPGGPLNVAHVPLNPLIVAVPFGPITISIPGAGDGIVRRNLRARIFSGLCHSSVCSDLIQSG